jgi:hypothetical protein
LHYASKEFKRGAAPLGKNTLSTNMGFMKKNAEQFEEGRVRHAFSTYLL